METEEGGLSPPSGFAKVTWAAGDSCQPRPRAGSHRLRVALSERTEAGLDLVDPAARETVCRLSLTGLAYATAEGFEQPERLKRCRPCSHAAVVPYKGKCGKQLHWYERHADGLWLVLRCCESEGQGRGTRRLHHLQKPGPHVRNHTPHLVSPSAEFS